MNTRKASILIASFLMSAAGCLASEPASINLEAGGVSFRIKSPNAGENNTVTITPAGLGAVNEPITRALDWVVGDAELADIDGDGTQELLLYVFKPGTGQYGGVIAYSTNGNKSLSEIFVVPPREEDLAGYGGHDEWKVVKGGMLRRFPVYREGDPGAAPKGGIRKINYKLRKGEAAWELVPSGVVRK